MTKKFENYDPEELSLRFELARERVLSFREKGSFSGGFGNFVTKEARFIADVLNIYDEIRSGVYAGLSLPELQERNRRLYEDLAEGNYQKSYCDPDLACAEFGLENGRLIAALAAELSNLTVWIFEDRLWDITVTLELFLQFVSVFESFDEPKPEHLRDVLYSHFYDYCPEISEARIRDLVDPEVSFLRDIVMDSDLSDPAYLYRYGEYVTESAINTASFLNSLSENEIDDLARVFAEGYRNGFIAARKDLSKKKTVNIRFLMGFERIVRFAVKRFEEMGLSSVIYRASGSLPYRRYEKLGFYGGIPSKQFEYDHMHDALLIMDEKMVSRRLSCMQEAFEKYKYEANTHGGPAVIDTFGEEEFEPKAKETAFSPSDELRALKASYESEAAQITNRYIIGSERSFTIIAFPIPDIGERFPEIFREITKINMLDPEKYRYIQQCMIDVLDQADCVTIGGAGDNQTELTVKMHPLADPASQTNFENCTADVNIPVGEVFTSPVLKGTDGLLHVSNVYLNGLKFIDLKIRLKDGMIADYSCRGPEGDPDGRKYIRDNILFGRETLPLGEFAIGTDTEAYRCARVFGIEEKLPILIAEKTGPHFAFGDTCYSFEEDSHIFNPDGKEIVAKDNECSEKRKTDPAAAYFNCHTDITIPFEELGFIRAVRADGQVLSIIENGRFVIEGTEELNVPLDELLQGTEF